MFESDNTYYIWNQMGGDVWENTISQDLNEILDIMCEKDIGGLKLKEVKCIETIKLDWAL
jgi:hypothetical protein